MNALYKFFMLNISIHIMPNKFNNDWRSVNGNHICFTENRKPTVYNKWTKFCQMQVEISKKIKMSMCKK